MPLNFDPINYLTSGAPRQYTCDFCGAHDCKLWRGAGLFSGTQLLACCECAGKKNNEDVSDIDDQGKIPCGSFTGIHERTEYIGWNIPAVPTESGKAYLACTAITPDGISWWRRLPSKPNRAPVERPENPTFASMFMKWVRAPRSERSTFVELFNGWLKK